ncbi:MAG: N-acetylmuramoyl-L-alanine amidase [Akkermansiaceae bacterium]
MIFKLTLLLSLLFIIAEPLSARKVSRVVIDPGHGGHDSGATRSSIYEKKLTLAVALKVEALLKKKGMPVTLTRRTDKFVSLNDRAAIANKYSNAIFISIHFNASTSSSLRGVETYYFGGDGQKLAAHIHLRLLSNLKCRNGQTRQRKTLAVLNKTRCPAILVECGYISNPTERLKCMTSEYHEKCAQAIVDGIWAYKTYN